MSDTAPPDDFATLLPELYDDLRRLAHQRLRRERDGHTLCTTALVHEAYLRLSTQHSLRPADRARFLAAASNTMRRVLVDYARAITSEKRGAGARPVPIDDLDLPLPSVAILETVALDQALARLERAFPRAAQVFEQRLFGGLEIEEIARGLNISPKTVQRDWQTARAWLRKEVHRDLES